MVHTNRQAIDARPGIKTHISLWKAIVAVAILAVALAGLRLAYKALRDPFEAHRFTPEAWALASKEDRALMARDAMRNLPLGMPAADVERLLGEPNEVSTNQLEEPAAVRMLSYGLGNWSLYYYDYTCLEVNIGADDRVISAVIGGG